MATERAPKTLREAILFFADYENCRKAVEAIRWPDGVVCCPTCDSDHVTYLASVRRYKCYAKHPKAQFSLKVGTIFEDSAIGLEKWLPALWLLTNCKSGLSSYELARALGVTQKTAWFMLSRLRLALQSESGGKMNDRAQVLFRVPSRQTPRIQETHLLLGHILCDLVDRQLFPEIYPAD